MIILFGILLFPLRLKIIFVIKCSLSLNFKKLMGKLKKNYFNVSSRTILPLQKYL